MQIDPGVWARLQRAVIWSEGQPRAEVGAPDDSPTPPGLAPYAPWGTSRVLVQNQANSALPRFSVQRINSGVVTNVNTDLTSYLEEPTFQANAPANDGDPFVITLQDLVALGGFPDTGLAVELGTVPVLVNVANALDGFAASKASTSTHLVSGSSGQAMIRHMSGYEANTDGTLILSGGMPVSATTGLMWCLVLLGAPGSGGGGGCDSTGDFLTSVVCTGDGLTSDSATACVPS